MATVRQSDGIPYERGARRTPAGVLRRAAFLLRRRGARTLLFKLLGETVYRRMVFVEDALERVLPPIETAPGIESGLLAEDEVDAYLELRPDQTADEVRRRLRTGQLCTVTRDGGRIVSAHWCARDRAWVEPLDCEIALAPDELYSYESYTDPAYRKQRLPAARARLLRPILRARGFRRRLGVCEPDDPYALRHAEEAGFLPIGRIARWRFGRSERFVVRDDDPTAARIPVPSRRLDWDRTAGQLLAGGYAVDPFLAAQKRRAYLDLVARWGGAVDRVRVLKTDLFEEVLGGDAFLWDVGGERTVRIGIDRSGVLAAAASRRDAGRRISSLAADARELPFADHAFALVVSPSTLDHFDDERDLERSLREIRRVLMPGGVLILTLDNRANVTDRLLRFVAAIGLVPFYLGRSYSRLELCAELEKAGFTVSDTATILHTPRLFAFAALRAVRAIGWTRLVEATECALERMQRFGETRFADRTGSFVAARAVRPEGETR